MKFKKDREQGVCWISRCKRAADGPLCEQHKVEWVTAGSPDLEAAAALPAKTEHAELQTMLEGDRNEARGVLELVNAVPLETAEERETCGTMIKAAGQKIKDLEAERLKGTSKLRDTIALINSWFKPSVETWGAVKQGLQTRLNNKLAELEAEQARARAAVAAGQGETKDYLAIHTDQGAPGNMRIMTKVTFAVQNANLVPDEFWCLDYDKIGEAIKRGVEIPGVMRIEERKAVAK